MKRRGWGLRLRIFKLTNSYELNAMKVVAKGCAFVFGLLVLAAFLFAIWSYFRNPNPGLENKKWLTILKNEEVDRIWLIGARSAELYNEIDTVKITDKYLITKSVHYFKTSHLVPRKSVNFKGQLPMCDATLFSGNNSHELYLIKLIDGRGLVETSRGDSIYQNTKLITFLDSIFQAGIKHK